MEIDFLIVRGYDNAAMKPRISPVDVKSTKRYGTSSLDKFRASFGKRLGTEYVLHPRQLQVEGDRVYLPLYASFCLQCAASASDGLMRDRAPAVDLMPVRALASLRGAVAGVGVGRLVGHPASCGFAWLSSSAWDLAAVLFSRAGA